MTEDQVKLATALGRVTYLPGTNEKRFARNMASIAEYRPDIEITEKQAAYMTSLAWKFRRQMPADLVPPKPVPWTPTQGGRT